MTDHNSEPSLYDQEVLTESGRHSMAAAKAAAQVMNLLEIAKESSGTSQSDLAQKLGVTEGRVSQVLNGDGNYHIATVARYLSAMGAMLTISASDKHGHLLRRTRRRRPSGTISFARTPLEVQWLTADGIRTMRTSVEHDSRMNILAVTVPTPWKNSPGAGDYQRNVEAAVAVEMKTEVTRA